jgi:hypothetical protein
VYSSYGVPVKVLDGYPIRGDMFVELTSVCATANGSDKYAASNGTKVWGFFEKIGGIEEENFRFIGEPPAGPLFDTGMPVALAALETKIVHTFSSDRYDELYLQLASDATDAKLNQVSVFMADATGLTAVSFSNYAAVTASWIGGAPNSIRDPKSPYAFYGVFGGNAKAPYLSVASAALSSVYVHGKFSRH